MWVDPSNATLLIQSVAILINQNLRPSDYLLGMVDDLSFYKYVSPFYFLLLNFTILFPYLIKR